MALPYETELQPVLVFLALAGYLGSIFTRDAFFSTSVISCFWLFIIAPRDYPLNTGAPPGDIAQAALNIFFYVPAVVALASIVGTATVKLLNVGQLVNVWLTGTGGGSNYGATANEEKNLPLLVSMVLALFFAFFFFNAATGAILYGTVTMPPVWAIVAGIVAALAAFGLLVASLVPLMRGNRFRMHRDNLSFVYTLGLGALLVVHYLTIVAPAAAYASGGSIAVAIVLIIVVDLLVFVGGSRIEAGFDRALRERSKKNDGEPPYVYRYGRLYSIEASWASYVVRIGGIILVHLGTYVLLVVALPTAASISAAFWSTLLLVFGIAFAVLVLLYIIVTAAQWYGLCCATSSSDDDAAAAVPLGAAASDVETPQYGYAEGYGNVQPREGTNVSLVGARAPTSASEVRRAVPAQQQGISFSSAKPAPGRRYFGRK